MKKSDAEWQEQLSAEQYEVLRKAGTEGAFTGKYWDCKTDGVYRCAGCGQELYRSDTKFDSGSGWPSFWQAVSPDAVKEKGDSGMGMRRVELTCKECDGHLGHLFPDGPRPTGQRHCINSAALDLDES